MGRKFWFTVVPLALFVVACMIGGVYVIVQPTHGTQVVTIAAPTPSSEVSSPSAQVAPTVVSSAVPEPAPLPHDFVAQAMPTSFSIVCGDETVIAPQSLTTTIRELQRSYVDTSTNTKVNEYYLGISGDTVALVKDDSVPWAAMPGSNADTVSIWGHADANPRKVFNPIAQFTGDPSNCQATVVLPEGVLGYGFVQAHKITPKGEEFNWSQQMSQMEDKAGKLLVTTCFSADTEVSWEFRLVSSKNTSAR